VARFEEGLPDMDNVTRAILGGPEGHFELLFPLNSKTLYYSSCFTLPEASPWQLIIHLHAQKAKAKYCDGVHKVQQTLGNL
jgi:hypothetical protein